MPAERTVPALLAGRLTADPGSPLLTFYDDATGERVELSAVTFANWVAKTANLLVDGLGLEPGDRAGVLLPLHWQSLAVIAGCWAAGLVVDPGAGPGAAVGFGVPGRPAPAADELMLLGLRPMGGGLAAPVPGATDYAREVLAHGDRFGGPGPGSADDALPGVSHAELLAATGAGRAARVLLAPGGDPLLERGLLAAALLDPLAGGGSAVIVRHPDPALLERRVAAERVTARP